jgi:hypothetical protein
VSQRIVAIALGGIGAIEVDQVIEASHRHLGRYPLRQITVRIDQCNTACMGNILEHHRFDEGGFPGPGLSDNVEVGKAVFIPDAEKPVCVAIIGAGKMGDAVRGHRPAFSGASPKEGRGTEWSRRDISVSFPLLKSGRWKSMQARSRTWKRP